MPMARPNMFNREYPFLLNRLRMASCRWFLNMVCWFYWS